MVLVMNLGIPSLKQVGLSLNSEQPWHRNVKIPGPTHMDLLTSSSRIPGSELESIHIILNNIFYATLCFS